MIKDRRVALVFRSGALLFAFIGLYSHIGVFSGTFSYGSFMYYTIQSNVLAILLFVLLTVRTAKGLREGVHGNAGWYPRLGMVCAVDLLVTLVVFWTLLAPQGMDTSYLLSFDNIAVHTITPLLCLLDFVLFAPAGRLKYRDVYYVCIFPVCYTVFSVVAGLSGYVYGYISTGSGVFETTPTRFPYFFLDFDQLGILALGYIGAMLVFFLLLGHAIYLIDHKLRKRSEGLS